MSKVDVGFSADTNKNTCYFDQQWPVFSRDDYRTTQPTTVPVLYE